MKPIIIIGLILGLELSVHAIQSRPHQVNIETYLLMNFSQSMEKIEGECNGSKVKVVGNCKLVRDGKWGQALQIENVNSGLEVQLNKTFPLQRSKAIVLEAWVYLEKYPENNAYIAEKVYASEEPALTVNPKKASFGFGLFITPEGEIAHNYTSIYYGKRRVIKAEGYQLPLKKWTHIAIMNAPWPTSKMVIFLNGKKVVDKLHEFQHRLSFAAAKEESTPGKFIVGNDHTFKNGFPGLLDEVRMYRGLIDYQPPPDNSFCDPEMTRAEIKDAPPYFMPEHCPVINVSFDETAATTSPKVKLVKGKIVPGVRGNGFIGNSVRISTADIFNGCEGGVEFWMRPVGWSNNTRKNVGIWGGKGYRFYVFNTVTTPRPLALYFRNDLGKNCFFHLPVTLCPGKWDHLAVTWKNGIFKGYMNGKLISESKLEGIRNFLAMKRDTIYFFSNDNIIFDEIRIYNRPPAPEEIMNSYSRYTGKTLKPFNGYSFKLKSYPSFKAIACGIQNFTDSIPVYAQVTFLNQHKKNVFSKKIEVSKIQQVKVKKYPISNFFNSLIKYGFGINTDKLSPGTHLLMIVLKDRQNKKLAQYQTDYTVKDWKWLHTKLGKDVVPPPFKPITSLKDPSGKTHLKTLMADFEFTNLGLISQITVNKQSLLAAPIHFTGSNIQTAKMVSEEIRLENEGYSAQIKQSFKMGKISIATTGKMDFDGFIKYKIVLTADSPTLLDLLSLNIPLLPENAKDYYVLQKQMDHALGTVPNKPGTFWNSINGKFFKRHELPSYGGVKQLKGLMTYGNFKPYAWLGSNHRGLAYMAENDRGWAQSDKTPALIFERSENAVKMRLNLIAAPVEISSKPRIIIVSLTPTPTKRPPKGFHLWKTTHHFVTKGGGRLLGNTKLQALYPADYELSRKHAEGCHKRGLKVLPSSIINHLDTRVPPFEYFKDEWQPAKYPQYSTGSLSDFNTYMLHDWITKCGIDGIYIDNMYPQKDYVLEPIGAAYRHEKGEIQPGFQLFAYRNYVKQLYTMMAGNLKLPPPRTQVHMTHTQMAPIASFTDIAYEGEDHYISPKKNEIPGEDHISYWPNQHVRVVDNPETWGVGTFFLNGVHGAPYEWKDPKLLKAYQRAFKSVLTLHNCSGDWKHSGFIELLKTHGKNPEFILYRDNEIITTEHKNIFISLYRFKNKLLAVIVNQNRKQVDIEIKINWTKSGLKLSGKTRNLETNKQLMSERNNTLKITIPKRDYKMILFE